MYSAAPQATMESVSSNHSHLSFVPDLASFGDFLPPSGAATQQSSGGRSDPFSGQGHRPNAFFANQPPTSLPRDASQHCLNCGYHPAAVDANDMRLQSLCSRVERVELAVVQMQLSMRSSMANHDDQLSSMRQQIDRTFLGINTSIGQLKIGMGKFFQRFADQFSEGEEGSGDDETGGDKSTSMQTQVTQSPCKQSRSPGPF